MGGKRSLHAVAGERSYRNELENDILGGNRVTRKLYTIKRLCVVRCVEIEKRRASS